MLTAMIFVCFYNTTARYLFNASTMWAEESIRYAAVWVTCVGASMTARAPAASETPASSGSR